MNVDVSDFLSKGREALNQQNFAAAAEAFRKACDIDTNNGNAWFSLAYCLGQARDYDNAIAAAKQYIRLFGGDKEIWNNMGSYLRRIGKLNEAIKAYENSLKADPRYKLALSGISNCYKEAKDLPQEIVYRKRLAEISHNAVDWNSIGVLYYQNRQYTDAQDYFKRALTIDSANAVYLFNYGLASEQIDKILDAYDAYALSTVVDKNYESTIQAISRIEATIHAHDECVNRVSGKYKNILNGNRYLNPYHLLNADRNKLEELDVRVIQRLEKKALGIIDLEGGRLPWIENIVVDGSQAREVFKELDDKKSSQHHKTIYRYPALLQFLTYGDLRFFSSKEATCPIASIEDDFLAFVRPYYCEVYDKVFLAGLRKKDSELIRLLQRGRFYVTKDRLHECFRLNERYLDNLSIQLQELLTEFEQNSKALTINKIKSLIPFEQLGLLPEILDNAIQQIVKRLRDLSICAYNEHNDLNLALEICKLQRQIVRNDTALQQTIEQDYAFLVMDKVITEAKQTFANSKSRKPLYDDILKFFTSRVADLDTEIELTEVQHSYDSLIWILRSVAIDICNIHDDPESARKIVAFLLKAGVRATSDVKDKLKEDFDTLCEVVAERNKHDVALTFSSDRHLAMKRDGITYGDSFIPSAAINQWC